MKRFFQIMTEPKRRSSFSLAAIIRSTSCLNVQAPPTPDFSTIDTGRLGVAPFTRENVLLWQQLNLIYIERDIRQDEKNFQDQVIFYKIESPDSDVVIYRTVQYSVASLGAQLISLAQQTGVKAGKFHVKLMEYKNKSGEVSVSASSPSPAQASLQVSFIESGITIESGTLKSSTSVLPSKTVLVSSYSSVLDALGIRPTFEDAVKYYTNPEYQDGDAPPGIEQPWIFHQLKEKDSKASFQITVPSALGVNANATSHSTFELLWELEIHFYRPDELKLNYELQKDLVQSKKLAERAANPWVIVINLLNTLQTLREDFFKKHRIELNENGDPFIPEYNGRSIPTPRVPFQMVITGLARQGKSSFVWLTRITEKGVFSQPDEELFVHDEFGGGIGTKRERGFIFAPEADTESKYNQTMRFTLHDLPGIREIAEKGGAKSVGAQEKLDVHQHAIVVIEATELFKKDESGNIVVRKDFRDQYEKIKFHEDPAIILVTKWDLLFYNEELASADELVARSNLIWEHSKHNDFNIIIDEFQAFSGIY